jgi:hypothetical protein
MDGDVASGGWEESGASVPEQLSGHAAQPASSASAPSSGADRSSIAAGAPPPPAIRPILRGTIVPVAGAGPRKYAWTGEWAMSDTDAITSPFQYSFELPQQYQGPPQTPGAALANPLMPSSTAHQVVSVPMSGFYLSKDKGVDEKPSKYPETGLKLHVGGPGAGWRGCCAAPLPGVLRSFRSSLATSALAAGL